MKNVIEVRHLGLVIRIKREKENRFIVYDYSTGKRVRHVRKTELEARDKAKEVAENLVKSRSNERALLARDDIKFEVRRAVEVLTPHKLGLLPAAMLLSNALDAVGSANDLMEACWYWKANRPDQPFTPTKADDAVDRYQSSMGGRP